MKRPSSPRECPVCGGDVPPHARACPHCGADERTGWDEEATRYDGVDLPESAFRDDAADDSPAPPKRLAPTGVPYLSWIIAAALVVAIVALTVRRFF